MVPVTGAAGASTSTTTCWPAGVTTPPRMVAMMMKQEEEDEAAGELIRRGPWTVDEDLTLINYIAEHGDGRWNALARAAGLKRTGKSCRLRWLNYLRPDVKRGDFTADEQLLILDLHSRWGNRWSKIARQLPGRTDNEIKNYWRTRVQKHARQLNCDVNSRRFKDAMRYLWMPRLAERAASAQAYQQQQPAPPRAGDDDVNDDSSCLSAALITTTPPPAAVAENSCYYNYCHSPGSGGGVVPGPSSSSSDSSLTSTESSSAQHEEKSMHHQLTGHVGGGDSFVWAMQGTDVDHEFWYSAASQQQLRDDDGHHPFQLDVQDLTGWVQGFSEGMVMTDADQYHQSLWSLDDIWRMH